MSKPELDEYEYIAALNQELKRHPDYEEGMKIVGVPEGASAEDVRGYNWKGPDSKMPGIVAKVASEVGKKYTLVVTRKR